MKGQRAVLVKGLKAFRSRLKWDFPEIRQFKVIEVKSKLEIFPFLWANFTFHFHGEMETKSNSTFKLTYFKHWFQWKKEAIRK